MATKAPSKVKAREAIVVVVGARPPVYKTALVRNRHTGLLAEVEMQPPEADPLDPGSMGRSYVFKAGEEVDADHEAVLDCPGAFVAVDE
jgi:hypothetical protein